MNIQIDDNRLEISPEIKAIIIDKLASKIDQLLPDLNNEIKTAFLNIKKDKKYKNYIVKFDMTLPGKNIIYGETCHHELISAITDLREAVEKQIKKYKQEQVNYSLG
jgi:ribosomal subunit interface protein